MLKTGLIEQQLNKTTQLIVYVTGRAKVYEYADEINELLTNDLQNYSVLEKNIIRFFTEKCQNGLFFISSLCRIYIRTYSIELRLNCQIGNEDSYYLKTISLTYNRDTQNLELRYFKRKEMIKCYLRDLFHEQDNYKFHINELINYKRCKNFLQGDVYE